MQIAACDGSREVATARDENFGDNPLEGNLLEGVGTLPRDDGSAAEDCFAQRLGAVTPRLLQREAAYCNHDMRSGDRRLASSRCFRGRPHPCSRFPRGRG